MGQSKSRPETSDDPSPADRRRHARHSGVWEARIETTRGERVDCVVLDLSAGGAQLKLNRPVGRGEIVTFISERLGTRGARIVWTRAARAGLSFFAEATHWQPAMTNPQFLRDRAQVFRRLGSESGNAQVAERLRGMAKRYDAEAEAIEEQQPRPARSIRKGENIPGVRRLPPRS